MKDATWDKLRGIGVRNPTQEEVEKSDEELKEAYPELWEYLKDREAYVVLGAQPLTEEERKANPDPEVAYRMDMIAKGTGTAVVYMLLAFLQTLEDTMRKQVLHELLYDAAEELTLAHLTPRGTA